MSNTKSGMEKNQYGISGISFLDNEERNEVNR